MRLFIAIGLPDNWKEILAKPQESIAWLGKGVKWVEPRGMHLTLRFLGEVTESELPTVKTALTDACRGIEPFSMNLQDTGVFPSAKRPRVYWVGIEAPRTLMTLQSNIERAIQGIGFDPEEHPFKPHLTLARIKEPIGKDRMTDALLSFKISSDPFIVQEVLLMQSHLSREGASYEAIGKAVLGSETHRT
jgi:RNA 2',3'-cyclic 3'-phosphodiesterase